MLKEVYVDDKKFEGDFPVAQFAKPAIARYVLAKINDKIEAAKELTVSQALTLEHVLPKNPGSGWETAIPENEDIADYVNRIGNVTLLEKSVNKVMSNKSFETKQKSLAASKLCLNKAFQKEREWTATHINQRGREFGKIAVKIWRCVY
jgi:hypothetical protein